MARSARAVAIVIAGLVVHGRAGAQEGIPAGQLTAQTPLAGKTLPRFLDPLPVLDVTPEPLWASYPKIATVLPSEVEAGGGPFTLKMCEFKANVLPTGTFIPGVKPETFVWGYVKGACPTETLPTYIGPVFVALRGVATPVRFVNELPLTPEASHVIAYRDSVDQGLHWADPAGLMCSMPGMGAPNPLCLEPFRGIGIPAAPHLHGGEVPPVLDGGPDAWFTSDGAVHGPGYYTSPLSTAAANEVVYRYPNGQEAGPLWFHDHALGVTRLTVYAGLAGGYVLVDPAQDIPASLKDPTRIVPLVLQDRMFDTNGELFFTSDSKGGVLWALNPEHPYWNPEFIGDVLLVNGRVWPYLEVEPKRYRFLFLNGSNARTYELSLAHGGTKGTAPTMYVVGTDGGWLQSAVPLPAKTTGGPSPTLVIMPGERYEVIIDFSAVPVGTRILLANSAKAPYPGGATPTDGLTQVLQFRVTCAGAAPCPTPGTGIAYDPASTPEIRGPADPITPLVDFATGTPGVPVQQTRLLTLNEVMGPRVKAIDPVTGVMTTFPGGPLEILVNNTRWSGTSARLDPAQPGFKGDFIKPQGTNLWYSELPQEGDTEIWEIANLTADAHPIHLHLVQFQLMNRQPFDLKRYTAAYAAAFPRVNDASGNPVMIGMSVCSGGVYCPEYGPPLDYFSGTAGKLGGNPDVVPFLNGAAARPKPEESGWKDTVQAPPGMVTRIAVRWAPTDLPADAPASALHYPFDPNAQFEFGYVWHCHIIDHEDNEMMRPDAVQLNPAAPAPAARSSVQGRDY